MVSSNNVIQVEFRRTRSLDPTDSDEPAFVTTVTPRVADEARITHKPTTLDEIYDLSEPATTFAAMARARFSAIAASFRQARGGDAVDRDEVVNLLKAELPRSFALDGWSDGALAIITALHHGLKNRKGVALDETQYDKVSDAVNALRDLPFLRFDRALDHIEALQDVGLETEPREASLLQTALHG
jgi:hypothetical protein